MSISKKIIVFVLILFLFPSNVLSMTMCGIKHTYPKKPKNVVSFLGKKEQKKYKKKQKARPKTLEQERKRVKEKFKNFRSSLPTSCPAVLQRSLFYTGIVAFTGIYYYIYNNVTIDLTGYIF